MIDGRRVAVCTSTTAVSEARGLAHADVSDMAIVRVEVGPDHDAVLSSTFGCHPVAFQLLFFIVVRARPNLLGTTRPFADTHHKS